MWQYHPLLVAFALGGIVSVGVTLYCWRYMQRYGSSYLVGAMGLLGAGTAIWVFAATLKTASASLDASLLFYKLEFVGAVPNTALGLVVALAYVGKDRWLTRKLFTVLGVISAIFVALIAANPGNVMITDPTLVQAQGIMAFEHSFTPLFAVYLAWVYGLVTLSLVLLARASVKGQIPKGPALVAILMLGIPLITASLKTAGVYPPDGKGVNVTPAASSIGISILVFAIVRYRVFDLIPVGRDQATELMEDGYLLLGEDDTILDANPAAKQLLTGLDDAPMRGRSVSEVVPVYEDLAESDVGQFDTGDRTIEARSSKVTRQNQAAGRVLLLQDVTRREQRKRELERYERVMENIPVGVYRVTPGEDGELLFGNQALAEIFGADSVTDLQEYEVRDFYVDPEERAEFSDRLLSEGEITNEEILMERLDGETFWASLSNARVVEDGTVYFEGALQDVTARKEYEQELKAARERVRSERDGKEAIRQLLLQTSTDEEIAASVCRLLVESYGYASAWVTRAGPNGASGDTVTVARHGDDRGFADEGATADDVTRRTLETQSGVTVTVDTPDEEAIVDRLDSCGLHSVRSVCLEHEGVSYGALTVVRTEPGSEFSQELVDEVAAAIAFKQQVHRQRDALTAETVLELELRLTADHFLASLTDDPEMPDGATLQAHELQADNGLVTYLVEASGVDAEALHSLATVAEGVEETTLVSDDAGDPVVRMRVETPTLGTVLSDQGGAIESMRASGGRVDVTAQFPRRTDVSAVVEALQQHWPGATMRTRREHPVDDERPMQFESLTEKQEEALRAATLSGFFDRPQRANATDVAETLDVSRTTFLHHLRRAEQKLFEAAFTSGLDDHSRPISFE